MRGKKGTKVSLTVAREGFAEPKVFTITRDTINLPTVETKDVPQKSAFVISLYTFTDQSPQLFAQALQKFKTTNDKNLIIDLRDNPGGYLDAAVAIAGHFLPQGDVVVKEIGKNPDTDTMVHKSAGPGEITGKNIYVLVNQGSASASEILSGALSEHGVATLIGERTFGKGSVQEVVPLAGDTSLKVTVAKWYTPDGVSISEKGLTPKIELKQDGTPTPANPDPVLQEALDLIK
jgi:carboxyl-terminal processing protease